MMPVASTSFRVLLSLSITLAALLGGCVVNEQRQTSGTQAVAGQSAAPAARPAAPAVRPVVPPAAIPPVQVKNAQSGIRQKLNGFANINPDCSSGGIPVAELLAPPVHGTATFENGLDYSEFPASNQRYQCNKQQSPTLLAYYTSTAGYKGRDEFAVKILFPDGNAVIRHYVVNID